jgi:uncharacterized membrane protein YdjX (TVP38/TMEM64 family)
MNKEILESLNALVRPLVTIMLSVGLLYGFVVGMITGDTFVTIVAAVLGFWFGKREEQKRDNT